MRNLKLHVQFAPQYIAPRNKCSREHSLPGMKFPGNFRSRKRKFPGTVVPGNECSQWELSLQGAKIPGTEKSLNHELSRKIAREKDTNLREFSRKIAPCNNNCQLLYSLTVNVFIINIKHTAMTNQPAKRLESIEVQAAKLLFRHPVSDPPRSRRRV